jgi:Signal transduction histidine kinase
MKSEDLRLLLEFLMDASAPLPHGEGAEPDPQTPRALLISYTQVVERLAELAQELCGASRCAVISQNEGTCQVDTSIGTDATSLQGMCGSHDDVAARKWREIAGENSVLGTVDAYGLTKVYLCLAWDEAPTEPQRELTSLLLRVGFSALRFQRKVAASRRRARWIISSRSLTDALLAGADEEEALGLVAEGAQTGAGADAALIFLPSVNDEWTCEIASGKHASALVGVSFPNDEQFEPVRQGKHGLVIGRYTDTALRDVPTLAGFGPLIIAPIYSQKAADGAIALFREHHREPFAPDDLPLTEAFASQTSLALEVASARHSRALAMLLEERSRISRDLHDFAVQQLFATGMKLDVLKRGTEENALSPRAITAGITEAMANLEEAVRQIRSIVHDLKETDIHEPFAERMEREASRARQVLGFAPSLLFDLDGIIIDPIDPAANDLLSDMSARVDRTITDDAAAILREALSNIARHAHAHAARIVVSVSGHGRTGELVIAVTDDGSGVDPTETRSSGLANMATRARLHGGSFGVGAGPGGVGTSLVWNVPLDASKD